MSDQRRKASESFRVATEILKRNPEGQARVEDLRVLAFQAILDAESTGDAGKLALAISHMAAQTSVAELSADVRLLLGKYWPR